MNRLVKTGILLVMLVVPVFLFLYLRFFGENHYTLPRYYPAVDPATGTVRVEPRATRRWYEPERDTVFQQVPAFQLLTQDSTRFTEAQMRGKITVVQFFSTHCGTPCNRVTAQLERVQSVFYDRPEILLLSHTTAPAFDTPAVLKAYARGYDTEPGRWQFLTGDVSLLNRLATEVYRLDDPASRVPDSKRGKAGETIPQNEKLVLVDKAGVIRGYYHGADKKDVDRLLLEIRVLLNIYQKDQP